eukprot:9475178-Pyramimonas_sp.AAC.1
MRSPVILAATMATAALMFGSSWMLARGRCWRACAPSVSRFQKIQDFQRKLRRHSAAISGGMAAPRAGPRWR